MNAIFAVAVGGAIGATGRYLFNLQMLRLLGPNFPWGTFGVNVIGSFIMGLVAGLFALRFDVSPEMRSFITTGILGGFTTFSAFSLDTGTLFLRSPSLAALYLGLTLAGGLGAFAAAFALGRLLGRALG